MDQPIVQGLLTFLGGAVVAGLNALLSARLLDKKPNRDHNTGFTH